MKKNNDLKKEELPIAPTSVLGYSGLIQKMNNIPSMKSLPDIIKSLHNEFSHSDRTMEIKRLIVSKNKKNSEVIVKSGVSKDYFYSVYQGKRNPSRNKTIQLCFGIGLRGEEANLFLKKMGHNELYLRNERDAIIYTLLTNGHSLFETEDLLHECGYETIMKE